MRKIIILGSTGSIGTQALDIVRQNRDKFEVVALAANGVRKESKELFEKQILEFDVPRDNCVLAARDGFDKIIQLASCDCDVVLNGITGSIGLEPTIACLDSCRNNNKVLALANKESLVAGGELVRAKIREVTGNQEATLLDKIIPVDSEHSAIWQSARAGKRNEIRKIILTASGGPFRGKKRSELKDVTAEQALNHPTWKMGPVVTINSSTLLNKGLELIEAAYLFDVAPKNIEVVVHPQSVVHSGVEFFDGAVILQTSPPDMRLPIALGLWGPNRLENAALPVDWSQAGGIKNGIALKSWDFEQVDDSTFPAVNIARFAFEAGPLYPVVMNAANETAVSLFLENKISYLEIIQHVQDKISAFEPNKFTSNSSLPTLDEIKEVENWARV
ncbi:MAG: 1-deoxy-D-xylulose-5-phosphate reductoisomerase [Candidatus Ancillula sp.]|jgi:1-deoxy-D-xylulose-5-phosphate reductoisomerase|nr:1-deoxy-D-xylulose-5-phosphate reductoisomerase [Candidatus Ancillula sp.]